MAYDKQSVRGIKIKDKVEYPGFDEPENVTLWCKRKLMNWLRIEVDDIYDVIASNPSVLDAIDGIHIYSELYEQLVYLTVEPDTESNGEFGFYFSVAWIVNGVSVEEANSYRSKKVPLVMY